jgi:hypothetical protein
MSIHGLAQVTGCQRESVSLEGSDKAVLIDAGTNIADLDKIVASITKKPVMLVATHVHPTIQAHQSITFPKYISMRPILCLCPK